MNAHAFTGIFGVVNNWIYYSLNSGIIKKDINFSEIGTLNKIYFLHSFKDTLGIPNAAGVLFPFFGILLSPMIAALAMSFTSVSVIANALRLRTIKIYTGNQNPWKA